MNEKMEMKNPPPLPVRLFWWFGIYIAAQLPLIPLLCLLNKGWPRLSWDWFLFPTGMAWWLFILTSWLGNAIGRVSHTAGEYYVLALMVLPWFGYAVHLFYSLRVSKRVTFLILMWILVGIVLFNLGSCASFLHDPPA